MSRPRILDHAKIKELHAAGMSGKKIARQFQCRWSTIYGILNDKADAISITPAPTVDKDSPARAMAAPAGWCDLTREGGWERRCAKDEHHTETRTRQNGDVYDIEHSEFDPGTVYPSGWLGPDYTEINVKRRVFDTVKRFIVFGVQDKTPACGPALNSMLAFAQFLGVTEIYGGRCTYNRKWYEAIFGGPPRKDVCHSITVAQYSSAFAGHLTSKRVALSDRLDFCGETNINPTASNPLPRLMTYGRGKSTLFPHPRQDLVGVPRHPTEFPINAQLTGYMTTPNYVDRVTGHISRFHHITGFTLVEIDAAGRHWAEGIDVNMTTGEFQHHDIKVDGFGMISTGHPIAFLKPGDIHAEVQDEQAMDATFFAKDSIAAVLRPEKTVLGDIIDFSDFSHHNRDDPWHVFEIKVRGSTVAKCVKTVADTLVRIRDAVPALFVDKGNHDLHPIRWLKETNHNYDPTNSVLHLEANLEARRQISAEPGCIPTVFEWMLKRMSSDGLAGIKFLALNDRLISEGVELAQHGNQASNGARGSIAGHIKSSRKKAIEHSHSPGKREGVCQAGYLGKINPMPVFARGGDTTWAHANTAGYHGGKMALIFIHDGKWRAGPRLIEHASRKTAA